MPPLPELTGKPGRQAASRWRVRSFSVWIALLTATVVAFVCASVSWPPLPAALNLKITFPAARAGDSEPIISTGSFGEADFLVARYAGNDKVVLAYDTWGANGPASMPVTYRPDAVHDLTVEMPSLYELPGASTRRTGPLRVTLDGHVLISADVRFHRRESEQIYFGENPVHGSTGALFHGVLMTIDGRRLLGGPSSYFSRSSRMTGYLRNPLHLLAVIGIGIAVGFFVPWMRTVIAGLRQQVADPQSAPHPWFLATAFVALLAFTYVVTGGTFHLLFPESFGVFYDHQAVGLLHGRLDVPEEALGNESFVYHGKFYGYFGPTPALMRIPFAALGVGFGKLSRSLMVLDFAVSLAAIYALLCQAVRLTRGRPTWPSRWSTVMFTATAALGSTLFYLGSRAYIYHEAIACGVAFALWAGFCALKYLEQPVRRWWVGGLVCGTLAVHARPPIGLFALVLVGVTAAINLASASQGPRGRVRNAWSNGRVHAAAGVLALCGVLSFNALSYLKFHTLDGCPLRYNVQYDAARLARIDGRQFHWSNLRFGLDAYLLRPTLRLQKHFPYFETHGRNATEYPRAKLDMTEEMAGLPYAMPALVVLALVGIAGVRRNRPTRLAIGAVWLAVMPPAVAMFMAIAVAHRYTGDFVPFLVMAGAFGIAVIEATAGAFGRTARFAATALGLLSIAITAGLTIRYQGEGVWGVPSEVRQRYHHWQQEIDGMILRAPAPQDRSE